MIKISIVIVAAGALLDGVALRNAMEICTNGR